MSSEAHGHKWQFAKLVGPVMWEGAAAYFSYWVCPCGAIDKREGKIV